MTTMMIKSRKLQRNFEFFMPDNGGHIYLEDGDNHGTFGRQICEGGGLRGSTVTATSEDMFKNECRRWYKSMMRTHHTIPHR